jgi:hypothetical protein
LSTESLLLVVVCGIASVANIAAMRLAIFSGMTAVVVEDAELKGSVQMQVL